MTLKKIEGHGVVVDPMVADLLHIRQIIRSLKHAPITGVNEDEKVYRAGILAGMEPFWGYLPIEGDTKAPMVKYKNQPDLSLVECLSHQPKALAIKSSRLLAVDYDDEKALDFVAERGIDFTYDTWHIRRTDNIWRFKTLFLPSEKQFSMLPFGEIKREVNYQNSKLDVFLSSNSYVIVDGQHEDGGRYFSPHGLDVSEITAPPKLLWDLVLEIASKQSRPSKRRHPLGLSGGKRLSPCPICGRNENLWCEQSSDGLIWCMKGGTFNPEMNGSINVGDVVNGFACVAKGDTCLTFRKHVPMTRSKRPTRRYRRVNAS